MKERKKIKYVQKQPPDKSNQSHTLQPNISQREQPRQPISDFRGKRQEKTQYQHTNKTYLVQHQDQEQKRETNKYQNYRREDNRPKFAPKDTYQKKYQQTANKQDSDQPKDNKYQGRDNRYNNNRKDRQLQVPRFIERESSQQDHHCIICSQDIRRRDWIWTCSCCSISMHLKCIKQWIINVNDQQSKKTIHIYNWKCPQCNYEYNEPLPQYYCYCGKHKNPEEDRDLAPHSCGQICGKKRGPHCPHLCPDICHRGKCKPCDYEGTLITCQCGKSQRIIKCSQQRLAFQCGKKCEKILPCQKHKCQRNCHTGECHPCKKKHMAKCYCGKNQDIIDCALLSYSCTEVCDKVLDCGFHRCEDKCHTGVCNACRKTPKLQKTCPCGKYEIEMLTGDPDFRQSCADIIPVCGMPCSKKLQCGHVCPRSCHEGWCAQCKIMVDQSCSCGLQTRKIQCWRRIKEDFKCEAICKKKRACGQHLCNEICCKNRTSPILDNHPCQLNCTKLLNCQKHQCGEPCHMGLCKKCPVIYSQPQPCPCGRTSLKPPIICGTLTPQCDNVCGKELICSHKCQNICHYGPCKCFEDVTVPCRCGKQQINTTCGRQALCLVKCQNILQCGHKCDLQCHKGTCEEAHKVLPCRKICNKQRADCHHVCPQICHPSQQCQHFPCQAQILVKCDCGHRQTMTLCGAKDNHKTRKGIMCNKKCDNLKRFDMFYKDKQIYYPGAMVQFAFKNYPYLQNLEARLQKYILHSDQNFIQVEYKFPENNYKILLTNLFENHYHLNTHFYRYRNYATFTLMQSENTMVPKPVLTQYVKLISKGIVKQSNLPFQFTISFQCEVKQKMDMILKKLKDFLHKYYSERSQKVVSLHFWSKEDGEQALGMLENQYQTIDFKCAYNITKAQDEVQESEITSQQVTVEETKPQVATENEQKTETQTETVVKVQSQSQAQKTADKGAIQSDLKQDKPDIKLAKQQKTSADLKKIPSKHNQGQNNTKLIIRKGIPTFKKNPYPESKQNIQDIYLLDEDQLYNQQTNWETFVPAFCGKNFGPEAIQWRIRSLLIINSFFPIKEHLFHQQFTKLITLYNKDKESAARILEIQRIETKSVKAQMAQNGIYLSDHQPEIMSYLQLYNFMAQQKINVQLPSIIEDTSQMQKTIQILQAIKNKDTQLFYDHFNTADYVYGCSLIPLVHFLRENILEDISKAQRVPTKNLYKHLLFDSQEQFQIFTAKNGLTISKRISKSTKEQVYYLKEGKLKENYTKDETFIQKYIQSKRDKKYYLTEPQQLVKEQYMTRSFFAFADFKESINPKYMTALVKVLKDKQNI